MDFLRNGRAKECWDWLSQWKHRPWLRVHSFDHIPLIQILVRRMWSKESRPAVRPGQNSEVKTSHPFRIDEAVETA